MRLILVVPSLQEHKKEKANGEGHRLFGTAGQSSKEGLRPPSGPEPVRRQ
jgi:hypothetical protein